MYCSIQQSIKSILLEMWNKKYFGSHLVIPGCHMRDMALEQHQGAVDGGGVEADLFGLAYRPLRT